MDGQAVTYIAQQLGHRDVKVTVEHYAKWLPQSNREAMNALPDLEADRPDAKRSLLKHTEPS